MAETKKDGNSRNTDKRKEIEPREFIANAL